MNRFTSLRSHAVVLPNNNIDTDQIIPARFLKVIDKQGLGDQLFSYWRYDAEGKPRPGFALNRPEAQGAQVLFAGDNFGCGSSREHAPWALIGWGIRAVIATSFADIFKENALKNGLLPVEVDAATHARLLAALEADPSAEVTVDLESSSLTLPDGSSVAFSVDPFARHCLLEGLDQLGYILSFEDRIEAYERSKENNDAS
jgi:3-isopropylmalate/(R)-2-methylmalate dehydratase small subunit